ncbi:hypothetical protein [Virgibacillus sediminis]|uniref:Transposase n=1 Tax=Virgibacillus sediminis TaxID=202260 RepID=A0ABV7A640_9BACI
MTHTLESINRKLRDREINARKRLLIQQLGILGKSQSRDGRRLQDLSLYSLEWMHIEEKQKSANAFGEKS